MPLNRYEAANLFFNANFKETTSTGSGLAYRGELILKEGEIADTQGRRKPPVEVMKQAIALSEGEKLVLLSGSVDALQYFPALVEKYGADIQAGTIVVLFVVNIDQPFTAELNGANVVFIPLVQGMTWNELIDMVALEKGDFKGQSAADKVLTLYTALKAHKFSYPSSTLEIELGKTNQAKRENHGAI